MKVVHTSDWHLGAKLYDRDRSGDHATFLAFLLEVLASERPDALIVSGDVFDVWQPTHCWQRFPNQTSWRRRSLRLRQIEVRKVGGGFSTLSGAGVNQPTT